MSSTAASIITRFRAHLPEYAMEAMELGMFMASASVFAILFFHPSSPIVGAIDSQTIRRLLMGLAMGSTAMALIYSPMGRRSGAHMNPAVTLTFWRLGKIENTDAAFYVLAQFSGAILGMFVMSMLVGDYLAHPAVNFVTTQPGALGLGVAWVAEFVIAFVLMLVVLNVGNRTSIARYTGLFAGGLVATFIFIEDPLSGMSMNPARTFGASLASQMWTGLWIYFTAPPLAMLLASELYLRLGRGSPVYCAKLNHFNNARCIFRCCFHDMLHSECGLRSPGMTRAEPRSAGPATPLAGRTQRDVRHNAPASAMRTQETLYFG